MSNNQHAEVLIALKNIIAANFPQLQVKRIFDIGARDCKETISLNHFYPEANICSFESNPAKIQECRERVAPEKNIELIEKAVSNQSGTVDFYQIDTEQTETTWEDGNPGASSLLEASGKYHVENYVQRKVTVECTTLHEEMAARGIKEIDLLWMDIQGSELNALKGLKELLSNVAIIHTEVEFMEIYKNQPLFWDIKNYLYEQGFYLGYFTTFSKNVTADAVFVNPSKLNIGMFGRVKYYFRHKLLHLLLHYGVIKLG